MTMEKLKDKILDMALTAIKDPSSVGVLSTGERIAVALVLNKTDWLLKWGWASPLQAADRLGPEWLHAAAQAQLSI